MRMEEITNIRPAVLPRAGNLLAADHLLGIEIELEGVNNTNAAGRHMSMWQIKEDGSLRDSGREFVLAVPLAGKQLEDAIDQYYHAKGFNSSASWEASHRCGIHIHSDVRDLTTVQYGRLLAFSMLLDDYFFDTYDADWRKGLNFCRSVGQDNRMIMLARRLMTQEDFTTVTIGDASRAKYMSLNLCRVTDIGSVEYRHFPSTLEKPQLLKLCDDIQHIKEYAQLPTFEQGLEEFKRRWDGVTIPTFMLRLLGA